MTNRQVLEAAFAPTTMPNRFGQIKEVRHFDPVFDLLEGKRARFSKVEFDGMIELYDNDGKVLPDLRSASQVLAY
jgi:hypothetical protein